MWECLNLMFKLCAKHVRLEELFGVMPSPVGAAFPGTGRQGCGALGYALLTALSMPRVSSMRKKTAAQAEDNGSVAIASG